MRFRSLFFVGLASLAAWNSAAAQTIIVDNFTVGSAPSGSTIAIAQTGTGSTTQPFSGLSASTVINPTGGTDAGRRLARAHVTSGSNALDLDNTGINNQFNVALGAGTSGHFHLYYGFVDYNPALTPGTQPGANYDDLSRDVTGGGNNSITLSILNPDHNGGVGITLISGRGTGSQVVASFNQPYVTGNPSNQTLTFFFSSFSGIDFTDLDQIIVEAVPDLPAAGDLGLDNILITVSSVPEPTTVAMMGLTGMVAASSIWYRRRNARKALNSPVA